MCCVLKILHIYLWSWGGVVVKTLRYYSYGPMIDSQWCHWTFQWHSFWPYHGPGVDSAPSENEYQEHLLEVKAAGAWRWRPRHIHVPNVMKSGSLNLLEPSGPHRACYRTPLYIYIYIYIYNMALVSNKTCCSVLCKVYAEAGETVEHKACSKTWQNQVAEFWYRSLTLGLPKE